MTQIKAVTVAEFGGIDSLQLESVPKPEPAPHEVLIDVHAAGVNPYDWMTREGRGATVDLPWISGWDLSGTIEAVGADVTEFEPGDDVFSMLSDERGSYAEYVTVPVENLVRKPESLTHTHAAGVPMASLTAWQSLFDEGRLQPDQRILIHAAAGGVGHVAVQLARWNDAHVVGTASASNKAYLLEIGVNEHVNYKEERFEDVVDPVDAVIDAVGGDTLARSVQILKPDGYIGKLPRPITDEESELLDERGVTGTYPIVQWKPKQLRVISQLINDGTIDVRIGHVFPSKTSESPTNLARRSTQKEK